MSNLDKSFFSLSDIGEKPVGKLQRFDNLNFQRDVYSALNDTEYSELVGYLKFFSDIENLESLMTDENIYALSYYCKNLKRVMMPILEGFDKGEKVSLLSFLIRVFFVTWDSRIGVIPTSVNKRAQDLNDFIDWEELRKDYPLAAKSNNYLLTNKKFLEEVKNKFLSDYSSKNSSFYQNIVDQIKDIQDPKQLFETLIDALNDIETGENMVKIYVDNYLLRGVCGRFYVDNEKKKKRQEELNSFKSLDVNESTRDVLSKMISTDSVEILSKINLLDDGQIKIIDTIVANFSNLGEKNQRQIRKYLIRLLVNKKPFKVDKFLDDYNLESLSDDIILLLDDLGLRVILGQRNEDIQESSIEIVEERKDIENEVLLEFGTGEINKKLLSLFVTDPLSAIVARAKLSGYGIENENLLRKQIESVCKSSKYVKDSLLLSLFKESFSRPILKHSGAYSLRAGGSGYRFILRQDTGGKYTIVGFYNHDDYEKILDGRKW